MAADENAAIIRRGYKAFNSADMDTLSEIFDESAVWHTPGRSSLAGELQHLLADDEGRVVSLHQNSAERQGKHLGTEMCLVFKLEDGRVTEGWEYFRDLYAWDEFWS